MLEYRIAAPRVAQASHACAKDTEVELDTSATGRTDTLNPVELLLAALAACMIKGVERAAPMIGFQFTGIELKLQAVRQDASPRLTSISYGLIVATEGQDRRLELSLTNVRKDGKVSNTWLPQPTLPARSDGAQASRFRVAQLDRCS